MERPMSSKNSQGICHCVGPDSGQRDVLVDSTSENFVTSVYRKPTNLDKCMNGIGECTEKYKKGVIRAYVINYDNSDSRVSIITDRGEVTRTYLLIHNAQAQASGEYSCAPSTASPDVVTVHILNGEATAAMQTNASSSSNSINNIRSSAHTTSLIQTLVTTVMVMMMLRIVVVTHRWWWWYGDTRGSTMRREGT
ncbi:uncharacterized protein LOC143019894 [Oratosquilla oratoria]|uniref:uncharacterized protein LOC143019894 n=1 Tax=Oratosquilla oratoria TaxID=337810 RepID=UPI003F767F87